MCDCKKDFVEHCLMTEPIRSCELSTLAATCMGFGYCWEILKGNWGNRIINNCFFTEKPTLTLFTFRFFSFYSTKVRRDRMTTYWTKQKRNSTWNFWLNHVQHLKKIEENSGRYFQNDLTLQRIGHQFIRSLAVVACKKALRLWRAKRARERASRLAGGLQWEFENKNQTNVSLKTRIWDIIEYP